MKFSLLAKISFGFIGLGFLVLALIFPYYAFDWGVEPCEGLATDASNCGDADMGAAGFMLIALPFLLIGVIGLIAAAVQAFVRWRKATRKR